MTSIRFPVAAAACLLAVTVTARTVSDARPGVDWPSFRGIGGAGVADGYPTATTWDVAARKNVLWSVPVAGLGHSSPVIWGNQLCLTTAISGKTDAGLRTGNYGDIASVNDDTSHTWKLLCYDKTNGTTIVDKVILTGVPKIKRHTKSTHANTTIATDGTRLIVMLGSEGLYSFDMKGTQQWTKDLGVLDSGFYMAPGAQWEFSSSPLLWNNVVIVQADVQKDSFLAAFDAATGKELWRTPRHDVPTFSTPAIHQAAGQTQIILNGWREIASYDFKTGQQIWTMKGGGDIPVPVPVIGNGLIYVTNAHGVGGSPIYAIRETATGNISLAPDTTSNAGIAWSVKTDGAYLISPILYRDQLYVTKTNGTFGVFNATTGERVFQSRLGAGTSAFTASTIAADGKLYFTNEDGDVYVIKAGTFETLATNAIGGIGMATPAVSEGVLYFRTSSALTAIR
jgi:outer membrane protein assembly factor BamB